MPKRNQDDIAKRLEKAKEELNLGEGDDPLPLPEGEEEEELPLVIILYRQEDSIVMTDRLYIDMAEEFGEDALAKEGDITTLGEEDLTPLTEDMMPDDGLFVVIGKKWLTLTNDEGQRRIDDPTDKVHKAIAKALDLDMRIVPILVYGATMPKADYLPEALRPFAERTPLRLGSTDEFDINIDRDMKRIIVEARKVLQSSGPTIL
jgi:hypothetical protein